MTGFGYGHGVLSLSVNKEALGAAAGGAAGVVQAVGLQTMDAQHQLGAPPVPALGGWGTMSGLINLATGAVAGGLSIAGLFGKGPVKNHPTVMAGGLTYSATTLLAQGIAVVTKAPSTRVPYLVEKAKRAMSEQKNTGGGFASASPGNIQVFSAPSGSQAAVAETFA